MPIRNEQASILQLLPSQVPSPDGFPRPAVKRLEQLMQKSVPTLVTEHALHPQKVEIRRNGEVSSDLAKEISAHGSQSFHREASFP
jgi:hypothetical protein